jgi:phosphatidate phosphatase LPIN
MNDLVDQMFPPINVKTKTNIEFSAFNYWRAPIPTIDIPELSPPSPTLSAKSGASSMVRGFSLSLTSRSSSKAKESIEKAKASKPKHPPSSPLLQPSAAIREDEDEDMTEADLLSGTESMPGSLPSSWNKEESVLQKRVSEAEQYKEKVLNGYDTEEPDEAEVQEEEEEEEDDEADDMDMDFTSVPVSPFPHAEKLERLIRHVYRATVSLKDLKGIFLYCFSNYMFMT